MVFFKGIEDRYCVPHFTGDSGMRVNVSCKLINNIHVVNDSAERGVKLASDFLCRTHLEQRYQHLLHVVENDCLLLQNERIKGHSNRDTLFLHM